MAPRKRASSSSSTSKKVNQSSQQPPPSMYGIQHFFERHSQLKAAIDSSCSPSPPKPNPNPNITPNHLHNLEPGPAQDTPSAADPPQPAAMAYGEEISSQASPEFTKHAPAPLKCFKFSTGLLIKQSQDGGGDDVTWKVSPVNERLKSLTAKQLSRMMRVLSDPPRQIASFIHPCLQKQNFTCSAAESLEKWLSSPTAQATSRSLASTRRLSVVQETEVCHSNGSAWMESLSKAFQTPPSASYVSSELTAGVVINGVSDELGCGQHRKALLELLDQVEDVITDELVPSSRIPHKDSDNVSGQNEKICNLSENKASVTASQRVDGSSNEEIFLVLEVSEKHMTDDSSHARNPYKVLRLLNELTGEERSLHLCDEWWSAVSRWVNCCKYEITGVCFSSVDPSYMYIQSVDYEVLCGQWKESKKEFSFRGDSNWLGFGKIMLG